MLTKGDSGMGDIIDIIQELYSVEFIWAQKEETGNGSIDIESRKRSTVPENSDVYWDTDLEIIVKTSTVCALTVYVTVLVMGPIKSLNMQQPPH